MTRKHISLLTRLLLCLSLACPLNSYAQVDCNLKPSITGRLPALDANGIYCIAKHTDRKATLIFTFAAWCAPCRAHLPNAIKLAKEQGLEFYVLVPEPEGDTYVDAAMNIVKRLDSSVKIAVIKDIPYGRKRDAKYGKFLDEIIPAPFPKIHDYSKYILLDKQGKVIMVTSWKDNKGNNWRNDSAIINKRLLPLLSLN